jgi:hypothetical protein
MTKEEKKNADTAKAEAEAKAKEEQEQADADNAALDQDDPSKDKTPDYKALLEEERKKREDAEKALAEKRFKSSERKRKNEDDEDDIDDDEDDKPLTKKDLKSILERERHTIQRETYSDRIIEIADEISDSPEEAELVVEIHRNRTFPSHLTLREQLQEAQAIANAKRLASKNGELKRALRSKDTASRDAAGTHRDPMEGTAPKMSAQDTESYKRAGFSFDAKDRLWKKKLPSGKFLIKDPKTKRTYVA